MIQDREPMHNVDSKILSLRFDCCAFLFYSLFAATFSTASTQTGHWAIAETVEPKADVAAETGWLQGTSGLILNSCCRRYERPTGPTRSHNRQSARQPACYRLVTSRGCGARMPHSGGTMMPRKQMILLGDFLWKTALFRPV
jgi:hypothetical protein